MKKYILFFMLIFYIFPFNAMAQSIPPNPQAQTQTQEQIQQMIQEMNTITEYAYTRMLSFSHVLDGPNPDLSLEEYGNRVGWASQERINEIRQLGSTVPSTGRQFVNAYNNWIDDVERMPVDIADFFEDLFKKINAWYENWSR